MRREDIQPAYYAMPDVVCPSCLRSGKYGKFHCDVGVVYACSYDAPIPGKHWFAACSDSRARVNPAAGRCEECGRRACGRCGYEDCDC